MHWWFSRKSLPGLYDVRIATKTEDVLYAHKCVLGARLEYFRCMFGAVWTEVRGWNISNLYLYVNHTITINSKLRLKYNAEPKEPLCSEW